LNPKVFIEDQTNKQSIETVFLAIKEIYSRTDRPNTGSGIHSHDEIVVPILLTRLKNYVLGESYNLTINFVATQEIKRVNKRWRQKDQVTDILSFPYSQKEGEMLICYRELERRCKDYNYSLTGFFLFLYVHSLWHLRGLNHSFYMRFREWLTRKIYRLN
jgi:probable rRNA maturation factor